MPKKFHALNAHQKNVMRNAGFLPKEIKEFDYNTSVEFNDEFFQGMIRSRRNWRDTMILGGWTQLEIAKKLASRYRKKKERSPWDFFRLEYATVSNKPKLTATKFEEFLKVRDDVSRTLGRAYGRIQSVKLAQRRGLKGVPRKTRRYY